MPTKDDVQSWEHLSDIDFPRLELDDILILVGADNAEMFITEQVRTGGVEKPWGFKYKLRWAQIYFGQVKSMSTFYNIQMLLWMKWFLKMK